MKKVSYILIPGLWDQRFLFGWFYELTAKWWSRRGMPTVVCKMRWVSMEPYAKKLERLDHCITAEVKKGREVVLVGVSVGGPMAIIGLGRRGVLGAVPVSGLLTLSSEDRRNKSFMATSWFEAAAKAERVIASLSTKQKRRILTLSGQEDDIIKPEREHIAGARSKQYPGRSHLPTIVRIMLVHPGRIKEFADQMRESR